MRDLGSGGALAVGEAEPVDAQDLAVGFGFALVFVSCGLRPTAQCVGAQLVAGALLAGALGVCDRGQCSACDALVELIGIGSVVVGLGAELSGAEAIASSTSKNTVSVVGGGMQSSWVGA